MGLEDCHGSNSNTLLALPEQGKNSQNLKLHIDTLVEIFSSKTDFTVKFASEMMTLQATRLITY